MANAADPSNYELFELTKNGKTVSFTDGNVLVTNFDYYESLLSPNITATMSFIDGGRGTNYDSEFDSQERSGTVFSALPLTGDGSEEVRFKITNSIGTLDFSQNPLYVNGAANPDKESQVEAVSLSLVSKSAITNQETRVLKNYSQFTNNGEIVNAISSGVLGLQKLTIEETKNKYPLIGNRQKPFDVILTLAAKSAPVNGKPGFFFYETKDGHNFRSIDSLIGEGPVNTYYRNDENRSSIKRNNDFKIAFSAITKNQNLIRSLESGTYTNHRVTFDPKTFEVKEKTANIGELPNSLGKSQVPTNNNKHTRIVFAVKDAGALSSSVEEGNSSGDPDTWQGDVQMRYSLLFTQMMRIQVPCNPNLSAGDVIKCELDLITPSEKEQGNVDPVNSGNYMILDLCHHYDSKRSFTSMTLVRDTYGLYTNKN